MNFERMENKIVWGDCLSIMKRMPDKSVDLVVTDPPYGESLPKKSNNYGSCADMSRKATNDNWDDAIPDSRYFKEMMRVSKNQIIFGGNYYWENLYSTRCYIIWDKRGSLPSVPFAPTEFAWTSFNCMSKKYTILNHGFIRECEKAEHPTQKPLKLIKNIVADFSNENDLILDCFLGSGTTAVACVELGRRFIGIEKELRYVGIARKRVDAVARQGKLFQGISQ